MISSSESLDSLVADSFGWISAAQAYTSSNLSKQLHALGAEQCDPSQVQERSWWISLDPLAAEKITRYYFGGLYQTIDKWSWQNIVWILWNRNDAMLRYLANSGVQNLQIRKWH